jgi:hypothetical protein
VREREASLAAAEAGMRSAQIALVLFNFDGHCGDVIVKLSVSGDLPHEAPVLRIGHHAL